MQGYLTPLHYATSKGHTDSVALLLAKGADVNVKDNVSYCNNIQFTVIQEKIAIKIFCRWCAMTKIKHMKYFYH